MSPRCATFAESPIRVLVRPWPRAILTPYRVDFSGLWWTNRGPARPGVNSKTTAHARRALQARPRGQLSFDPALPATSFLATAQPELAHLPSQSRPGPAPSGMSAAVVVAGRMRCWSNRISPRWPPQPLGLDLE